MKILNLTCRPLHGSVPFIDSHFCALERAVIQHFRLASIVAVLLFASAASPQAISNSSNSGSPENAVFHGSDIDAVQTNNGGLTVSLDLAGTPGRGISTGYRLVYSNKVWKMTEQCTDTQCTDSIRQTVPGSPTKIIGPFVNAATAGHGTYTQFCNGSNAVVSNNYTVTEPDGTIHHMVPDGVGLAGCNIPTSIDRYADDGSGWMIKDGSTAMRKDGLQILSSTNSSGTTTTVRDTNGNQGIGAFDSSTLATSYTDSMGRTVPALGYYDANGVLRNIQVEYTSLAVHTLLCPPQSICNENSTSWTVPSIITLANGLHYSFGWDSTNGQLSSITLPSGAQISYTYQQFLYSNGTADVGGWRVKTRTVTVGTQSSVWNYSYSVLGNMTVIDQLGNQTDYICGANATPQGAFAGTSTDPNYVPPCAISEVDYYTGNGSGAKLLKTVQTEYWETELVKPKAVTTTVYSSIPGDSSVLKTRIETDYDTETISTWDNLGNPLTAQITRGNVTETREYSYDSAGNNPVLARRTRLTYLSDSNAQYLSANITDRITDKSVYDCVASACTAPSSVGPYGTPYSGGKLVAETKFAYDGGPVVNPDNLAAPPASVPGHDDADYGTGFTLRGNLTQTSVWLNTSNTWLPTSNVYDALGHLVSTTDPGGHTTTLRYSDDWNGWSANSSCLPSSNSFAFLTDTTNAKGQRSHTTYFPCTGQVQTSKDQNDLNTARAGTTFTYDLMKRLKAKTASDGGSTTFDYADTVGALSATETTKITSSLSEMVKTGYDDLGRVAHTYLQSDPDGVTTTDITYDELGRTKTVSNPYRSTSDSTYGITTTVYDALGRVTTVIPPGGSPTANNLSTQYGGNYTISTDQAGHQRKRYFDSLGRVIEVDEPSSSFPGAEAGGSVNIAGTLQSGVFGAHSASSGSGSVSIGGFENVNCINNRCTPDRGTVSITVNGHPDSTTFAGASTTATIASGLTNTINADAAAFVTASCDDSPCSDGMIRLAAAVSPPQIRRPAQLLSPAGLILVLPT